MLRIRCSTNAKSNVRQQWNADLADAADKKRIQTRVYPFFPPHQRSKMLLPLASAYLERKYLLARQFPCCSVMLKFCAFCAFSRRFFGFHVSSEFQTRSNWRIDE
jgi:hypothetical protein